MIRKEGSGGMQAGVVWDKKLMEMVNNEYVPNRFFLDHAIERRKKEIRWIWLYLPFTLFAFVAVYFLYGALVFHVPKYVYLAFVLIPILAFSFKISFYQEYLNQCDRLMLTVAELLAKMAGQGGVVSKTPGTRVGAEKIAGVPESAGALEQEKPAILQNPAPTLHDPEPSLQDPASDLQDPTPVVQDGPVLQGDRIPGKYYFGDELLPLYAEAGEELKKGRIKIFLLDQLLRHECGRPSIHDRAAFNINDTVRIPGCKNKNIISQFNEYHDRESIRLKTTNSLSTHKKYLRILKDFYERSGDLVLQNQAKDLFAFLSSIKLPRKKWKMRLPT
jgi:hypothetical protein